MRHPEARPGGGAITVLLAVFALCGPSDSSGAAKSYDAESYITEMRLLPTGELEVREAVVFRFEGGPFTYAYRWIPRGRLNRIDGIESPQPHRIRRKEGRTSIRWSFPASSDTIRSFTLSYKVDGAVWLEAGHRVLKWHVFPTERDYAIRDPRATLILPESWPPPIDLRMIPASVPVRRAAGGLLFEPGPFGPEQGLRIEVVLPEGVLPAEAPAWQAREERWRESRFKLLALAGLVVLIGAVGIVAVVRAARARYGLDQPIAPQTTPPSDLTPGLAGALKDGMVNMPHMMGCLADLATRGFLRFETEGKKSIFGQYETRLRRLRTGAELSEPERIVFDRAFSRADTEGVVRIDRAWTAVGRSLRAYKAAVEEEMIRLGYFDPEMIEARSRRMRIMIGVGVFVFAGLVLVPLVILPLFGPLAILIPMVLSIVMALALIAAKQMRLVSETGRQRALPWIGFAKFLQDAAREKVSMDPSRLDSYLPYALAFGLGPLWAGAAKKRNLAPPAWFHSLSGTPLPSGAWAAVFATTGGGAGGGAGAGGGGGASGGGGSGAG